MNPPEPPAKPQRIALPDANAAPAPLLVSGTIAYDDIETPRARATHLLGGSAAYAALAASYFTHVRIAGLVGGDFAPDDHRRLRDHGIDTTGLRADPDGETFCWHGRYHENYNHRDTLETRLGVNAAPRPPLPSGHAATPCVLLANDAPALQLAILDQLTAPRFILADTMTLWIATARDALREVIHRVHLLILNDDEAAQLTGETNPFRAAARIRADYHARHLLIKKGEHGAILFYDNQSGTDVPPVFRAADSPTTNTPPDTHRVLECGTSVPLCAKTSVSRPDACCAPAAAPAPVAVPVTATPPNSFSPADSLFILPAYPVTELHDPTGAGDSFAGAFMGVLAALQRTDFDAMKLAMLHATAVASLTVEAFSCDRLETAGPAEISRRVRHLRALTQLPSVPLTAAK